jgi:hypothetical protein
MPIQMLVIPTATACPFETFADSPHIQISESFWIVDIWGQACGFGVSGGMEIRAVNERTHQTKTIASLGDIHPIKMRSTEPKSLTVTLPNLVDMTDAETQFDDVKVTYEFTPHDDPEARTNFQHWKHHPDDPQAREWYCRNILAKMDRVNRASWNAIIGKSHAGGQKYCPDQ